MVFWCGSPVGSSMRLEYCWSDRSQKDRFHFEPPVLDSVTRPTTGLLSTGQKEALRVRSFSLCTL